MKYQWQIFKGRFLFWLYGRKQKEEGMRRRRLGLSHFIVGYQPKDPVAMSGEQKPVPNAFKNAWKENNKKLIGSSISWHIASIKRLLKESKDVDKFTEQSKKQDKV